MRALMMATAMLAMAAAGAASAGPRDRAVQGGPGGAAQWRGMTHPGIARPAPAHTHGSRWGGHVQGRWWAGWRAPGGWAAYRRPMRGWVLPGYWIAPNWGIADWRAFGLPQPPAGYGWSRYYDDAVLIDGRGSVYDTIGGVDWDALDPADTDYTWRDVAPPPPPPGARYRIPARDSGAGGAGVDPAAGYAIDRAGDRGPPPPPGIRYSGRGYPGPGYPPPPVVTTSGGATLVSTSTSYGAPGYYAGGYYYPGTTVTTVTIQPQPVVAATTETWVETRPVRKVRRRR